MQQRSNEYENAAGLECELTETDLAAVLGGTKGPGLANTPGMSGFPSANGIEMPNIPDLSNLMPKSASGNNAPGLGQSPSNGGSSPSGLGALLGQLPIL